MNITKTVRIAKIGYILISAVFCMVGVFLMFYRKVSAVTLANACGGLFLVCGAVKLMGYFSKDMYQLAFQFDFAMGLFVVVIGLLMLIKDSGSPHHFEQLFGILVLADGLLKLQTAVDAKRFGIRLWWMIGGLALLASILGVLLIFYPAVREENMVMAAGSAFILDGALNLSVAVCAVKSFGKGRERT
ncbi:MAG: DUF308 domain-containing protein [Lachnospiraceae bacterium]|nr:DUF308 domain-containing protein [Lachnospiraceae bacterium]